MEAPIPPPRLDDDEDVHWALSTAGALWGRGERAEALKWLRRAAEQASDVNADVRALELFKAAADVAAKVKDAPATPVPPAPPRQAPSAPPPPAPSQAAAQPSAPPPPAPMRASVPPQVMPSTPPPPAAQQRRPPPPPPRPGSMYPPPPVAPAAMPPPPVSARPGSIPAPPPPAPPPPAPPPPAVRPSKPSIPAIPPAVAAQAARAVAISAKPAAPPPAAVPPKRRRSFTGESRAAAEKQRTELSRSARAPAPAAPATTTHKPRRRTFQDEATQPKLKPVAMPPAVEPSSIWDDLDEDTRVLSSKPTGEKEDVIEQAFEKLRTGQIPQARHEARVEPATLAAQPAPAAKHAAPIPAAAPTVRDVHEEATSDGAQSHSARVWSTPAELTKETERPPNLAQAKPAPAKPLVTLPALRVAVLGTSVPGEVRLITLDPGDEPPPGAAVAVLVPMSAADGEAVARLFGGND